VHGDNFLSLADWDAKTGFPDNIHGIDDRDDLTTESEHQALRDRFKGDVLYKTSLVTCQECQRELT
jgi:hypothetical protein